MISELLTNNINRLRLKGLLETLEVRLQQAEKDNLSASEFLQLLLQDEVGRRDAEALVRRLQSAKFESQYTFDNLLLDNYPSNIQRNIRNLQAGNYLLENKSIIIMGPTGTGKTHLAHALGHAACCRGVSTHFIRSNALLRDLQSSRADLSWSRVFNKYLKPKLLILDDFALKTMSPEQAEDVYELIAERHGKSNFIITSNRTVDAWVKLFPDPVMANAALDRLANNAYQIILEGESFRRKNRPSQQTTCNN